MEKNVQCQIKTTGKEQHQLNTEASDQKIYNSSNSQFVDTAVFRHHQC